MSTKSIISLNSLQNREKTKDTIPCRIEFIKDLLKGNKLESLVDFDNTNTECYRPPPKNNDESSSRGSHDTRIVLKKRIHDFTNVISEIGGKLKYIKSGTSGHTFKGEIIDKHGSFEYAVKVVAYPRKERYGNINDVRRPENAEVLMIKLLSYFIVKKQTPHIVLPIGTFDTNINTFIDLIDKNVVDKNNDKYCNFVQKHKDNQYYDNVSILISEWANRGDLLDYIRNNYKQFTPIHWKVIIFQILSVLAVIQSKYPSFRHNDMKANNILIHRITKQNRRFTYKVVKNTYKVPNIGYHIKLWDFDFACIPGVVDNKKVQAGWTREINVTPEENKYYDIHYFFNTLIKKGFCQEIMSGDYVPSELKEFIDRVVPKKYQKTGTKYVHKRGRILVKNEYTSPDELLKNDEYFEEFRQDVKSSKTKKNNEDTTMSNITNFLKSSSNDNINVIDLLGKSKKRSKKSSKNNSKNKKLNKEKTPKRKSKTSSRKKKNKEKQLSRTISSEIRQLDPDMMFD
jgi:hypothetical protein